MTAAKLMFVDTSIYIARILHGPGQRERVEECTKEYLLSSGLVCRQEFKRRVLGDAHYLQTVLLKRKGFENTHAYLTKLSQNTFHKRRATICLHMLAKATGKNDQDKTDRLMARLRTLILTGLSQFDGWLDAPAQASQCGCGSEEIRERAKPDGTKMIELGRKECGKTWEGQCGIESFLIERSSDRNAILSYLLKLPPEMKTSELNAAEEFLRAFEADPKQVRMQNPCLKAGDLIIALEAAAVGAKVFYTMNGRESQHLCRPLGQTLIVRPPDDQKADIICDRDDSANWHNFS